jgi:class 3 adenylate cyclase/CheY-like chemotaxis protein
VAERRIVYVGGTESDHRVLESVVRDEGSGTVSFLAPTEALAALGRRFVDLLLIDLLQPSHDVLALMRAAHGAGGAHVPIIVTAPVSAHQRIQACLQRGAEDYLTTPFDTAHPLLITRRMEACLRTAVPPETMAITVPPIVPAQPSAAWENAQTVHRFIPREFLDLLDRKSLADVKLGDHVLRDMTVFFSDIRDFTQLSERLSPAENFSFLTSYLRNVTPIIREAGGFVDKYLGDGVMALFPGDATNAVGAAVEMNRQLGRYNSGRQIAGYVPIRIGMGLHRGSLMLGTIGAEDQMQTTVIADAVNLASRIEGMTKTFGTNLLLSGSVVAGLAAGHPYRLRALGAVAAKGKSQSVEIFECYDNDDDDLIAHKVRTAPQFAAGVAEFRKGMLLTAGRIFARIAEIQPRDAPAAYFRDRCSLAVVRERNSGGVWDGVEHIEVK